MRDFLYRIFCKPIFAKSQVNDIEEEPKPIEKQSIFKKDIIDFFQEELTQSSYIKSCQVRRIIRALFNPYIVGWGQELMPEQKQALGYGEQVHITDNHLNVLTEQAINTNKPPKEILDELWKQAFAKCREYERECLLTNNIDEVKISLVSFYSTPCKYCRSIEGTIIKFSTNIYQELAQQCSCKPCCCIFLLPYDKADLED